MTESSSSEGSSEPDYYLSQCIPNIMRFLKYHNDCGGCNKNLFLLTRTLLENAVVVVADPGTVYLFNTMLYGHNKRGNGDTL